MSLFQVTKKQVIENYELRTVTGDIVSFTPSYSQLLPDPFSDLNVTVNVVATGGNGTPDNPNPIVGYSSANITRCGVNLWDEEYRVGNYSDLDGEFKTTSTQDICSKNLIHVLPNTKYYSTVTTRKFYYDVNGNYIGNSTNTSGEFTTPNDCYFMNFRAVAYGTTYNNDISILYPSDTTPAYHAYNGQTYTVSFGQTVYGGVLDVTRGKLHVTHFGEVFDGSNDENWGLQSINTHNIANFYIRLNKAWANSELSICDRFTIQTTLISDTTTEGYLLSIPDTFYLRVNSSRASTTAELKTWLESNNVKIVYPLATPFDIDLTPVQIRALVGENNVFADCGETTVTCLI